jgi:hypothetical protein
MFGTVPIELPADAGGGSDRGLPRLGAINISLPRDEPSGLVHVSCVWQRRGCVHAGYSGRLLAPHGASSSAG